MKVVLDTNVIQEDYLMKSGRFTVLLDYVKRTESTVVLPQIVYEELTANYRRELQARHKKLVRAREQVDGLLPVHLDGVPGIDIELSTTTYLAYARAKLSVTTEAILPYKNEYLADVLRRAIERRRPCSDRGEEIRDAVLWHSILDLANASTEKVAFVSKNTDQFAVDKTSLHPDLEDEARSRGISIEFYPSLEDFARRHATPIEFITKEWIASQIKQSDLVESSRGIVESFVEHREGSHPGSDEELTGYVNLIGGDLAVDEYFIYEMENGSYRLEITWFGVVEVEYEAEVTVETDDWDYDYEFDPTEGGYKYQPVQHRSRTRRARTRTTEVEQSIVTEAFVENGVVVRYKAIDGWLH
jgi:predicted nucleic acid-binding protein